MTEEVQRALAGLVSFPERDTLLGFRWAGVVLLRTGAVKRIAGPTAESLANRANVIRDGVILYLGRVDGAPHDDPGQTGLPLPTEEYRVLRAAREIRP